jgi:hypothetical protein
LIGPFDLAVWALSMLTALATGIKASPGPRVIAPMEFNRVDMAGVIDETVNEGLARNEVRRD